MLAQAATDELRRQHVLLPPVAALEKLCAAVATRAQREVHRLLTAPLTAEQRMSLDQLLSLLTDWPISKLAWLRQSPGEPSAMPCWLISSACRPFARSACLRTLAAIFIRTGCCVWRVRADKPLSTNSKGIPFAMEIGFAGE
ncbi:hypothetical protein [Paraburkholderia elongata]|uniref:Uncharacterized protein n=1 Tax=Paraburkholderia elongata TaxID=2675747 RepID=A0A972NR63_9BURK|nr:hypothetical protein [Paraburkholderia elongata]NPT58301.1 hypothetical protein [Paraburkholderia elongata]